MQTTANALALVSIEGAKRLEKSAKLAAALLPNLVAAAEALEVARTLGKSDQEFFGELVQVAKAERPRMLAIELLGQGMKQVDVARKTGLTQARISQIKKENSKELSSAVKLILDFLGDSRAPDHVWHAINVIASPAARKMIQQTVEG